MAAAAAATARADGYTLFMYNSSQLGTLQAIYTPFGRLKTVCDKLKLRLKQQQLQGSDYYQRRFFLLIAQVSTNFWFNRSSVERLNQCPIPNLAQTVNSNTFSPSKVYREH
jgi:hypothetical protein